MWSRPFLAMFTNSMRESSNRQIHLHEVEYGSFKQLLEFCYKGSVDIKPDRVIDLLLLADRFAIGSLRQSCLEFIERNIDVENCCALLDLAAVFSWTSIQNQCLRFIESNFPRVSDREEYLLLDQRFFIDVLTSDDVLVSDESLIFQAAYKWVKANSPLPSDPSSPSSSITEGHCDLQLLEDVMSFVRFPLMQDAFLRDTVLSDPNFKKSPFLLQLVQEALDFIQEPSDAKSHTHLITDSSDPSSSSLSTENDPETLAPSTITAEKSLTESMSSETLSRSMVDSQSVEEDTTRATEFRQQNFRFRSRNASSAKELLFASFGDQNGLCYHIGTNYGKQKIWYNPCKTKKVVIAMSSPTDRYTKPFQVVGRAFSSTSYTTGNPAWCSIDLGAESRLICNYYTLRSDGSSHFLINWSFQGSLDGIEWITLRSHINDETIFSNGQYGGWPVYGHLAQRPYRFFRVYLTPSLPGSDKLAISDWELYGYFSRTTPQ